MKEIERKFEPGLTTATTYEELLSVVEQKQDGSIPMWSEVSTYDIEQVYLGKSFPEADGGGTELCLRQKTSRNRLQQEHLLTVKRGALSLGRGEVVKKITREEYFEMIEGAERRVQKVRRVVHWSPSVGEHYRLEIDDFAGRDLILIEVEFPTVEAASAFEPPSWFGREVTQDESCYNKNIARETVEV